MASAGNPNEIFETRLAQCENLCAHSPLSPNRWLPREPRAEIAIFFGFSFDVDLELFKLRMASGKSESEHLVFFCFLSLLSLFLFLFYDAMHTDGLVAAKIPRTAKMNGCGTKGLAATLSAHGIEIPPPQVSMCMSLP